LNQQKKIKSKRSPIEIESNKCQRFATSYLLSCKLFFKHLLFCFCLILTFNGFGQQNLSLHGLNHLIDQQSVKPTYFGEQRFELSLFPISINIFSNGPTYEDFLGGSESERVLIYPEDKFNFGQGNFFRVAASLETFRLIYTPNNWSFSLSHAIKGIGLIDYSGALPAVAIQGNAPFIGQNISLDTDFSFQAYQEYAFGAAIQLDNITIGGRLKYLSGIATVITRKSEINLLTDDDIYQLFLDMDVEIDVAGNNTSSLNDIDLGRIGFNFSGNHGVGIDLGIDWQINESMSFSVSLLDIGEINWKKSPRTYTANETFEFDGLSLGTLTFDGEEVLNFDTAQDSLDIIKFDENPGAFSTNLSPQLYVGVGYEINEKWHLNATGYYTSIHNNTFSAFSLGANYQLFKNFNIGTAYGVMNDETFLLGLNATLQLGSLQLYAMTDNILSRFQLENSRTINTRFGLGFTFGSEKNRDRDIPSL